MNRFIKPIGDFAKKMISSKPVKYTKNQTRAPILQSGTSKVTAPYKLPKVTKPAKTPSKPRMKQYGDRGYKPSSGKGVGI